jgi:hypothetical protein
MPLSCRISRSEWPINPEDDQKRNCNASLRSAARLQGRALLTDTDLHDENGLPA